MSTQCILCYEDELIFGIGQCNHGPICFKCIIKCRNKMDNRSCPICKENLEQIILSKQFNNFQNYDLTKLLEYENGILYTDPSIKKELDALNQYVCWLKPCKDQSFNTIGFFKRHLKEKHSRYLCEICVEFKTALLKEQKLYNNHHLDKHLKNGDYDDDHNLIFFHPYCTFCAKYFYNEEHFSKHMHKEHLGCHICGEQEKFRFYADYKAIETHFKMTHYLCLQEECLKKGFIVFKYLAEKEFHDQKVHGTSYDQKQAKGNKNNKFNLHTISGFHFEQNTFRNKDQQEDKIELKDNEGINFEYQYMSQRKVHFKDNKNLEQQIDKPIDIRDFYQNIYDQDDETPEEYSRQVWNQQSENQNYHKKKQDYQIVSKEKYVKQSYRKQEQRQEEKQEERQEEKQQIKDQQQLFIEDVKLYRFQKLQSIDIDKFDVKLQKMINKDQFEDYAIARTKYFKSQLTADKFFKEFIEIMGKKLGFRLFPIFITSIPNNETSQELDKAYYDQLILLPKKNESLLLKSSTILDLLKNLLAQVELNIEKRVIKDEINVNYQKYDKCRLIQLFEILKRVQTHEFGKLKFCSNFGVKIDLIQLIKNKLIFMDQSSIQIELQQIETDMLLQFMIYLYFSVSILTQQKPIENKFHKNILMPFLDKRPQIKEKYFKKKIVDSSDEENVKNTIQIQTFGKNKNQILPKQQKVEQTQQAQQTLPQQVQPQQVQQAQVEPKKPVDTKVPNKVINSDKFEFPVLENEQVEEVEDKKKKIEQNDWINKKNQNPFIDYQKGTIKSEKELQSQFPDLLTQSQPQNNQNKKNKIVEKKNDDNDSDEEPIPKKNKNKRGKQVVLGFY